MVFERDNIWMVSFLYPQIVERQTWDTEIPRRHMWYSRNAINYFLYSAITDILDKDYFTLEELLEEDELLQEVKARNSKLIDL